MTARRKHTTEAEAAALELECAQRDLDDAEAHFSHCNDLVASAANNLQRAQRRQMEALYRHRAATGFKS